MNDVLLMSLDTAGHLIQVALTPMFLLSGIAALLNLFASRAGKVADRLDELSGGTVVRHGSPNPRREITSLHRRALLLDGAVILSTIGAIATCLSIVSLFILGVRVADTASLLVIFFGTAIVCTLLSVGLFGGEMLLSSGGVRARMRLHAQAADVAGSIDPPDLAYQAATLPHPDHPRPTT